MTANPLRALVSEAEELAEWLDAKYRRHGEDEDRRAAAMLRKLAATPEGSQGAVACWRIRKDGDEVLGLPLWTEGAPEAVEVLTWGERGYRIEYAYTHPTADAEDAARYRWLRDRANDSSGTAPLVFMTSPAGVPVGEVWDAILFGQRLDAALDAARGGKG